MKARKTRSKPRKGAARPRTVAPRARARVVQRAAEIGPPTKSEPLQRKRDRARLLLDLLSFGYTPSHCARVLRTRLSVITRYLHRIGIDITKGGGRYNLGCELNIATARFQAIRRKAFVGIELGGALDARLPNLLMAVVKAGDSENELLERLGIRRPVTLPPDPMAEAVRRLELLSPADRAEEQRRIEERHYERLRAAELEQLAARAREREAKALPASSEVTG